MKKLNFKKGETVQVLSGEDRGKQGRILNVIPTKGRAVVEGLNMISKHTKPNAKNQQGGIIKQEASIHVSNLMLVDPSTGEPCRVGRKKNKDGKLVRYSKKTGETIK
jgi:large subunit ribosomal protein L24